MRTIFRDGKQRVALPNRQAKREQSKAARKLNAQAKAANTRAKYGPGGKPAEVTVRRMDTGRVVGVVRQAKLTRQFTGGTGGRS